MNTESSKVIGDGGKDALEYFKTVVKGQSDPIWFIKEVLGVKELFPMQEKTIREFYRHKYDPSLKPYKEMVYVGGMRGGKTVEASLMGCYEFFEVITQQDPASHWGLLKNQLISIATVASSERQVQDGVFYNMQNLLGGSEWFNTWFDIVIRANDIYCPEKDCKIRTLSSSSNTARGRSHKAVIFDELDLYEGTEGAREAWKVYNALNKSTVTFGDDGKSIAISSPSSPLGPNGIIKTLYRRGTAVNIRGERLRPQTYAVLSPSWEMNPNLDKKSLMEEYKFDMDTFWSDFACMPELAGGLQFPEGVKLYNFNNVLDSWPIERSDKIHVAAIDPAATNDAFGFGVGYYDIKRGVYVIDGVTKFTRNEGEGYVKPSEIRKFLKEAADKLNIQVLVFDTWMYPDVIEYAESDLGIITEKHIVDKIDYDRWRGYQSNGLVEVVNNDTLKFEAESLIIKKLTTKLRVDHPSRGSKDLADCVANVLWYLSQEHAIFQTPKINIMRSF